MPIKITDAGIDIPHLPNPKAVEQPKLGLKYIEEFYNKCHNPAGSSTGGEFCETAASFGENVDAEHRKAFTGALRAIEGVHDVPSEYPKVNVEVHSWVSMGQSDGSYAADKNLILINDQILVGGPAITFVHEYGHHLTLGLEGNYSLDQFNDKVDRSRALSKWRDAVNSSDTIKGLRDVAAGESDDKGYFHYLTDDREVFARSYAQYIALRSGDRTLRKQFKQMQEQNPNFTWTNKEFEPIANALDDYFASQSFKAPGSAIRASALLQRLNDAFLDFANPYHDELGRFTSPNNANSIAPTNTKSNLSKEDAIKIRRWAKANGIEVGVRGRIPQSVIDEYDASGAAVKQPERKRVPGPVKNNEEAKYEATPEEVATAEAMKKALAKGVETNTAIAIRREAAIKAVGGNLALFGDTLNIVDDSWDPANLDHASAVSQHLQDLSKLPPELIERFVNSGGKVIVGNGPITELDASLSHLKGVRPRGWPPGTGYDDVAGVYNPQTATVVLGNIRNSMNTPVSNFAFHEFGHAIDALEKKIALISTEDQFAALHSEFKRIASASGHLNNYYVQSATPGAGASEFFADGFRAYMKAQVRANNGFPEERNAVVRNAFAEAGTYVPIEVADKIIRYYDQRIMKQKESTELTRGQKAAATRAKNKASARSISFTQERRIRSLRQSGKTYAEISEELNIPIGSISYLLGKES